MLQQITINATQYQIGFLCCFYLGQSLNAEVDAAAQKAALQEHLMLYKLCTADQKKEIHDVEDQIAGSIEQRTEAIDNLIEFLKERRDQL